MGCPGIFGEDPEHFLKGLGLELASAVDPEVLALLEPRYRVSVNAQLYWVANDDEAKRLREKPFAYTGRLRDPVTREWFEPGEPSPRRMIGSQLLYFASEETAAEFDRSPEPEPSRR